MAIKLLEHRTNDADLFYSQEIEQEASLDEMTHDRYIDSTLDGFLDIEPYIKEFINLQVQREGLRRTAILSAHGGSKDNKWYFKSNTGRPFVQKWINEMDGKYAALILRVCNPGRHQIFSKKSAVLAPNETFSLARQSMGYVQVELYIPTIGYINGITVDAQKEDLTKLVEASQK